MAPLEMEGSKVPKQNKNKDDKKLYFFMVVSCHSITV